MDEKEINLSKILEEITRNINSVYPFGVSLSLNPKEPFNSFILTTTKKAFNKFEKQILQEIFDYFENGYKVKAEIKLTKKEKPLLKQNVKLFFQIKVN